MDVILPTPHAGEFTHSTMSAPSPPASPPVPRTKNLRYSYIRNITGSIEEYAKEKPELFELVIKPLTAIRENCIMMNAASENVATTTMSEFGDELYAILS